MVRTLAAVGGLVLVSMVLGLIWAVADWFYDAAQYNEFQMSEAWRLDHIFLSGKTGDDL
jgi:hypothetical protein